MKLAISSLACPAWTLDQIIAAVAAAKIDGIDFRGLGAELDITRLPEFNAGLPATLKKLDAHHITLPCYNTSVVLTTTDDTKWSAMLDECQRYAALAEKTHSPFLRVFGGSIGQLPRDQARAVAQRHLRQLVKICKPHRTMPLMETHDDWITAAHVMEVVHEFDPSEVGVLWDVEHPYRRGHEKPADTAAGLRKFLKHTHFKDSRPVDGKYVCSLVGQGDLPLTEIVAALRGVGFDGYYSLETEKRWQPTAPAPEQSIPQFAEFMRAM